MIEYETLDGDPSQLQYLGSAGITMPCVKAISRLLQCGETIKVAWLLSSKSTHAFTHAFILHNQHSKLFIIRSGFRSGYNGEGPYGLAMALQILQRHKVEIEELDVSLELIEKLDKALLTEKDIEKLAMSKPVRPDRWYKYVLPHLKNPSEIENPDVKSYYPVQLPFWLIDNRIFDLALCFSEDKDATIVKAYRRLEDTVRQRSGITESGAKLFSKAFMVDNSPLYWNLPDEAESKGRGNLFSAVYTAFRNARAHREIRGGEEREFLLINELFLLDSEAVNI